MISSWGIVPTVAADGKEALARLNRASESGKPYRLILLDLQMPGMSGFEVARRVKESPFGADAEIILLTSLGEKGDAARCKEFGISGYLVKPVKQSELLDAVMMALGHPAEEKTSVITRYTIQEARRRLNILLAEDNLINQRLATKLLETRGHRVVLASNGREAVEALDEEVFDLILMDIQMPEMDGFEATKAIRNLECGLREKIEEGPYSKSEIQNLKSKIQSIPIVAMTAHALKGDREKCLEAGMDDYVSKPINAENLFSVIEKLVHGLKDEQKEKPFSSIKKKEKSSKDVFDLSKALEVVVGNKELFQEIANLFLENLPGYLTQIKEEIARGDANALEQAAHSLKGSMGNFGARRAYEAVYFLERLGAEGKVGQAEEALTELRNELNTLESEMKSALEEMKNEGSDC
jgi:CheY-like chemotaxis protein